MILSNFTTLSNFYILLLFKLKKMRKVLKNESSIIVIQGIQEEVYNVFFKINICFKIIYFIFFIFNISISKLSENTEKLLI